MADSIFTQIYNGLIPGEVIYEDEHCFAINDINPQAPTHILIIPKKHINKVSEAAPEDASLLGNLLLASKKIVDQYGLEDSYRLVINNGAKAGQTVFHIHVHLLSGRALEWPPG